MDFADEADANAHDPVPDLADRAIRCETLMARPEVRDDETVYWFDIRLQGDRETVFFDV